MGEIFSFLSALIGFLGGGSALVTLILYRKQSVRIKNAEAYEKEVGVLRVEIAELRKSIEFERQQREQDKKVIASLELLNTQLHGEKNTLEIKKAKNKRAINQSYKCTYCNDVAMCPVLIQVQKNEEEYLSSLQK